MFPRGFDNAYAYEAERRKDEMRDVEKNRLGRKHTKMRRPTVLQIAVFSAITLRMIIMFLH